jgi:hypothetical protein
MINTIFIGVCTAINCALAFYWIRRIEITFKENKEREKRKRHFELCLRCIEVGSCPHDCEKCAWGDAREIDSTSDIEKYCANDVKALTKCYQRMKVRKLWKNLLKKN